MRGGRRGYLFEPHCFSKISHGKVAGPTLLTHYLVVVSNTRGLPPSIVTTGITLVQLETKVRVPAHVEDRDAKWSLACRENRVTGSSHTEIDSHSGIQTPLGRKKVSL